MNAFDVVAYVKDGAVYHPECFGGVIEGDYGAIFGADEWDYRPTCDKCGEPIEELGPEEEDL